jgi:hypothetical protein
MGTVYNKTVTKAPPAGAKIIVRKGQRLAEWRDANETRQGDACLRERTLTHEHDFGPRRAVTCKTGKSRYPAGRP